MGMIVQFRDWTCLVHTRRYSNDRVALQLVDAEDGSPVATATVNLPDVVIPAGHVAIKDYSENEGMLNALRDAGVIGKTVDHVQRGAITFPIVKLNMEM